MSQCRVHLLSTANQTNDQTEVLLCYWQEICCVTDRRFVVSLVGDLLFHWQEICFVTSRGFGVSSEEVS